MTISSEPTGNRIPARKKRVPVHGVLLLDKPAGLSSNDALIRAKRLLNAEKAGHTGTLDPFATGLLPLCFGEATKFAQDLLDADKTYLAEVRLGARTSTGDIEGEVLERIDCQVSRAQVDEVLTRFRGQIEQMPPMYSALKRDGKPLYAYARAGITVEREMRSVTIHQLDLLDLEGEVLTLRVRCSKGTYIRVLGEDIGAALGCGAHLQALRRTEVGRLRLEQAITLEALAEHDEAQRVACLAPVDALLSGFPEVRLPAALAQRLLQGQRLALQQEGVALPAAGRVRVYRDDTGVFLGSALLHAHGVLAPERLVATGQAVGATLLPTGKPLK